MQNDMILRCLAPALALAAVVVGCGDDAYDDASQRGEGRQLVNAPPIYPTGPYGTTKGSIIPQYQFVGFQNPRLQSNATQTILLADFYNPHADDPSYAPASPSEDDRLFPVGSYYGSGAPKPRALSISVSSAWCGACKKESKTMLPTKHALYKPLGGEFLTQLNDGPTPGHGASQQDLLSWATNFDIDYPVTIDPGRQLNALFVAQVYPANIIVDTRTMAIVEVVGGIPSAAYWTKFEETLRGD
jgi:hypothetical protein